MSDDARWSCPQCGELGRLDDRPQVEIAGLMFRSVSCERPAADLSGHPFPVRWLEGEVPGKDDVREFEERFVLVRGPLPEDEPIALAFGDIDPIRAWIEDQELDGGFRVLIRL